MLFDHVLCSATLGLRCFVTLLVGEQKKDYVSFPNGNWKKKTMHTSLSVLFLHVLCAGKPPGNRIPGGFGQLAPNATWQKMSAALYKLLQHVPSF
jgi:hypothetical protein